ncbi:class I SAM-dependent methyltransferase [Coleofasciculus sp.]|uniref:class I SAM-dependent methyltransferase n=1 Tax=Coleofasciculus sp. TaxID=3100458 RepID=UPI0039FAE2B0
MNFVEQIHGRYIFNRRVDILSDHLAKLIPQNAHLLDVGCGDGLITDLIMQKRPDIQAQGIDVLVRNQTHIPVIPFDGQVIPFDEKTFDVVMFVDVLHHTEDPMILLREAARVTRRAIVLKDHTCNGLFAGSTLRFMDKVGNERYSVVLPYNYWSKQRWFTAFEELFLKIDVWNKNLSLYPLPLNLIFDRSLHFVSRLYVT